MSKDIDVRTGTTCPACGVEGFGRGDDVPVTTGGWHGDVKFAWGRYAGVHMVRIMARRCPGCGHVEVIDPEWD